MKRKTIISLIALCMVAIAGCGSRSSIQNVIINTETAVADETEEENRLYYSNPITSLGRDAWYDYGTGDPYVMRYNGKYYLYMSTRDTEVGVKCFSSKNLVDWVYEGLCTEEPVTKGAYAPEVVYYNGNFYMYTSPAGNGHYVLKSDSPAGPFERITENMGMSIDGSVFIDDDGKWYFYHAGDQGIRAHEMTAPYKMEAKQIDVNAFMNGWTEGPMVIKTDGRYYLTYTGNHVFARGYRIDVGVSDKSPVSFTASKGNPVLVHTMGDVYGIGHSSSVKGPDLDSYYIVYHTLIGRAVEGMPKREMNIDRIAFNGDEMTVLGPTTDDQQAPAMPKIYSFFEKEKDLTDWEGAGFALSEDGLAMNAGDHILSKGILAGDYTAEFNLKAVDAGGVLGVYFNYTDEMNHGCAKIDVSGQTIEIEVVKDGSSEKHEFEIKQSFGEPALFNVNEALQIEKCGNEYEVYYNDRLMGSFECDLGDGHIGYFTEGTRACFGYIGGSEAVHGSSIGTYEKPIPGTVQGVHFSGASDNTHMTQYEGDSESLMLGGDGSFAEYAVNIMSSGEYDISLLYASDNDAAVEIYVDGTAAADGGIELQKTGSLSKYRNVLRRGIALTEGYHTLKFAVAGGNVALKSFTVNTHEEVKPVELDYSSILDDYSYSDGSYRIKHGVLTLDDGAANAGKRLYGSEQYGDYMVTAVLSVNTSEPDTGILVRTTNPSLGSAGDSPVAGTHFLQGYNVSLRKGSIVLEKNNFNVNVLACADIGDIVPDRKYEITVSCTGNNIKVSVDGIEYINYTDEDAPYMWGMAGVRTFNTVTEVDSFELEPVTDR